MFNPTLIVKDDEFRLASKSMSIYLDNQAKVLKEYEAIISKITSNDIPSGSVHDALVEYGKLVKDVAILSEKLSAGPSSVVDKYINKIDGIDDELYISTAGVVRDFSKKEYDVLTKKLIKSTICMKLLEIFSDGFSDKVFEKGLKYADSHSNKQLKKWFRGSKAGLLDYMDMCERKLNQLFEFVYECDANYGVSSKGDVNGYKQSVSNFAYYTLSLNMLNKLLKQMRELMNPSRGVFTVNDVIALRGTYNEMLCYVNQATSNPEGTRIPNAFFISRFIETCSINYFDGVSGVIDYYQAEYNIADKATKALFNMFPSMRARLRSILKIRNIKESPNERYSVELYKAVIITTMNAYLDAKSYDEYEVSDAMDNARTVVKYLKKYGNNFYSYCNKHRRADGSLVLDGRTIPAKELKKTLSFLDTAGDVLKITDKGFEYLTFLLTDYSEGAEILDSMQKNANGNVEYEKAIKEIKSLYDKEYGAIFRQAAGIVTDNIADETIDSLLKKSGTIGEVIAVMETTIDITGVLTGDGEIAKGLFDSTVKISIYQESVQAYCNALSELKQMSPSDEGYEQAAKDLANTFTFTKNAAISMFDSMAKSTSSQSESAYYWYCKQKAMNMSMYDTEPMKILTYDQWSNEKS